MNSLELLEQWVREEFPDLDADRATIHFRNNLLYYLKKGNRQDWGAIRIVTFDNTAMLQYYREFADDGADIADDFAQVDLRDPKSLDMLAQAILEWT